MLNINAKVFLVNVNFTGEQFVVMIKTRLFLPVMLVIVFMGQETPAQRIDDPRFNTITIYWENDALANTDRDYTNGIKLTWSTPYQFDETQTRLPRWSYPIMNRLPYVKDTSRQRSVSLSVGQNIYTPEDIEEPNLIEDDRPYAGILYLAFGFHSKKERRKDSWEFDIGMVGPNSYAEQTQNRIHNLIGSPRAQGWDHQLEDELSLEAIYETQWRLLEARSEGRFGYDLISHVGARLGNVQFYTNGGAEFRIGWNLAPNFGTCPIRPGCETDSAANDRMDGAFFYQTKRGLHFFLATDGRLVFRDIFLDGNTFHDSHRVDKKNFVADLMGGIGIVYGRVKASYAYVYRTKQFETQDDPQIFGAFTLSYSF